MTSRRSSGSSRAESAVEPTRSQNITVSCRRSASTGAGGSGSDVALVADRAASRVGRSRQGGDRVEQPAAMADRAHAELFRSSAVSSGKRSRHRYRCRGTPDVLFEAQPAQPRRYVHAVILGSEERQPLMDEDIPLPVDLPAAALK